MRRATDWSFLGVEKAGFLSPLGPVDGRPPPNRRNREASITLLEKVNVADSSVAVGMEADDQNTSALQPHEVP